MPLVTLKRCPNCNSTDLRRSRKRNLLERIPGLIVSCYRLHVGYPAGSSRQSPPAETNLDGTSSPRDR
jgi:hypothetical protein